uniref:4Fe-4S dicluster domain-containing protein n=1 Tax=Candidatus Methanomethylicus mesodigestus TaxID=1867258 RepID=A0A7C3IXF5_9CREN
MYFTTSACNKCGKCWEICPTDCIKHPEDLPFSCTTCGICASVCPTTAIRKNKFGGYYVDRKRCTLCGMCVKHCPFDFAKIVQDRVKGICVRCGLCVKVCPENARIDALNYLKPPIEYQALLEIATPEKLKALLEGKKVEVKAEVPK